MTQIALFGEIERADWIPPLGSSATATLGYRCPACGDIEPNAFLLQNNHWVDVNDLTNLRWWTVCIAMQLRANHAEYDRRQAEKAVL